MKCQHCSFETQSFSYFHEHLYEHEAEFHAERARKQEEENVIKQFKVLLDQYDRANVDYIHTPDEEEAKRLKTLRYVLSDHLYHMYCENEGIKEIERLWKHFC